MRQRPAGRHIRLAERAAFDAGAQAIEWRQGGRHWKMRITLPTGREITYLVSRRMAARTEDNIADWVSQRMRLALRSKKEN